MTQEQVTQFLELYTKFKRKCQVIADKLTRYDEDFCYVDDFTISGNTVECSGSYTVMNEWNNAYGTFDTKLLTYSTEEIDNYVDLLIEKRNKEKALEEMEREKAKLEADRKVYERLKKIFG